jgi:phospholipase C
VTAGEAWTAAQVDAIVAGGLWEKTAIFVTWDDWGGWTDHVDPPQVEAWSDGSQFRYGNRVPCIVLGAYARPGCVSHQQHSHVSLIRYCETTFNLPNLNARTQAASDLGDCFDYTTVQPPPTATPTPAPPPTPTRAPAPPTPSPATLTAIRDAAARAHDRVTSASSASTDAAVLEELRWALEDINRITTLAGGQADSRPGRSSR